MDIDKCMDELTRSGWTLVEGVYSAELMERVKVDYYSIESQFVELQKRKGLEKATQNSTHHTHLLCPIMLELLEENKASPLLERYFGGKYTLSTMGLSKVPPCGEVYTQNIHRDQRNFSSDNLWLNTLIMLDDSTIENGTTYMLEGSHDGSDKPDRKYFYENAVRAEGKQGDVLVFHGNIWHAAGENLSSVTRHIITPIYCKPFIKQQLDYPRAFGSELKDVASPHLKQVLGFNALTPATLEEFYQQDEDRYYKSDQG